VTGDRRTFLSRLAALGATAAAGGVAGCVDGDVGSDDGGNDGEGPPDLSPGVEIGVVSTKLVGLVSLPRANPDEPGRGMLITVQDYARDEGVRIGWRRTVEREITPSETTTTPGVGTTTESPPTETVTREGTVTATGLADAHEPLLPIYWGMDEEIRSDTSAMWLSREAFRELRDTRETAWSRDVLTRMSRLPEEALERVREGTREVEDVTLRADPEFVDFDIFVGEREVTTRAIRAVDDFGNEYVVLNLEGNPMIAEFTFDVRSTGFTGFDTGLWTLIKGTYSGYRVTSVTGPGDG